MFWKRLFAELNNLRKALTSKDVLKELALEQNRKGTTTADLDVAKHLAARVIMALRCGFKVRSVSIDDFASPVDAIVCDWKNERATYANDTKLIGRAFGFVYIGTIIDQKSTDAPSAALRVQVDEDMTSAQEVREAAVEWNLVPTVADTNPLLHNGYKVASRLLRGDAQLVDQLAVQLCESRRMIQRELETWFGSHAKPLALEKLEDPSRFDW